MFRYSGYIVIKCKTARSFPVNQANVFPFLHLFTVVYSGMIARSISLDIPLAFHILRFFSVSLMCDFSFIYAVFAYFIRLLMMSGVEALVIKEKDLELTKSSSFWLVFMIRSVCPTG